MPTIERPFLLWHFAKPSERVAIINIRGHGVGAASLQRATQEIVIAGNRILPGPRPREVDGRAEGFEGSTASWCTTIGSMERDIAV